MQKVRKTLRNDKKRRKSSKNLKKAKKKKSQHFKKSTINGKCYKKDKKVPIPKKKKH